MFFVKVQSRRAFRALSQQRFHRLFLFSRSYSSIQPGVGKNLRSFAWGPMGRFGECAMNPFSHRLVAFRYSTHVDNDHITPELLEETPEGKMHSYRTLREGKAVKKPKEKKWEKKLRLQEEERLKYIINLDWEAMIQTLLDLEKYPVGFTNTSEAAVVAQWCQQTSMILQLSLSLNAAISLEPIFQLLDRLFHEEQAHDPSSGGVQVLSSADISSFAIESVFKSWKMSLLYPPYYENMDEESLRKAQDRIKFYGNFLAKHEDSMIGQVSKLLDPKRIFTKTKSTDRKLWSYIPHTVHPNAEDETKKRYSHIDDGADGDDDGEYVCDEKDR